MHEAKSVGQIAAERLIAELDAAEGAASDSIFKDRNDKPLEIDDIVQILEAEHDALVGQIGVVVGLDEFDRTTHQPEGVAVVWVRPASDKLTMPFAFWSTKLRFVSRAH